MYIQRMWVFVAVSLTSTSAAAHEFKLSFSPGTTFPIYTKGKASTPMSTNLLVIADKFDRTWIGVIKIGFVTPYTTVRPMPLAAVGGALAINDAFGVGLTAGYKLTPRWIGTASAEHTGSITAAPYFPLGKGFPVTLYFPIGLSHNATAKATCINIGFEIGFALTKF